MWLNRTTQPVLTLSFPKNAICDITLDVVLEDSPQNTPVNTTVAAAGANYLLALDHGPGGYFWVPVAYNTTQ